jgi:putative ABC transport system permease protein
MFFRLLIESFIRQKRRKALAGIAILLGTTAVTAMLALATTIGDRIHRELAVYGANIVVTAKAADLEVRVGGVDLKPATGNAYLHESDLTKLKNIFWANNITGISPELPLDVRISSPGKGTQIVRSIGLWFDHPFGNGTSITGATHLHPTWKLNGSWPNGFQQVVVGNKLATKLHLVVGDKIAAQDADRPEEGQANSAGVVEQHVERKLTISGIAVTGDSFDDLLILPISTAQQIANLPGAVSRIEISAKTRPEDAFARLDPDKLSGKQRDTWYCRPYANSIAYQIREAIPGSDAQQVRRVEQSEGTVLQRISGLMWLVSFAALLAAGFAVSAAMATAVLERRGEIGLMRSLGASKAAIAGLFYAESSLLALAAGILGYLAGSALAWWLGGRIFPSDGASPILNLVLLPVIVAMAIFVAIAGSTPAIRSGLKSNVSNTLRGDV